MHHVKGFGVNLYIVTNLFFAVANLPMTLIISIGNRIQDRLETGFLKFLCGFFFAIFKIIQSVSNLMIMYQSRQNEYRADNFALSSGYGVDLSEALTEIYEISFEQPKTIKELLKATHPHITKRIERLEIKLMNEQ